MLDLSFVFLSIVVVYVGFREFFVGIRVASSYLGLRYPTRRVDLVAHRHNRALKGLLEHKRVQESSRGIISTEHDKVGEGPSITGRA